MQFDRFVALIGTEAFHRLAEKNILLAGLGGVGSYVFEALVRSGVRHITIVDHDVYDITNCNRQLHATLQTVGKPKVEVCRSHAQCINPDTQIQALQMKIEPSTIHQIPWPLFDYIIDCVDTITAKVLLLEQAMNHQIKIIHSMGFANKMHPEKIQIAKLNQTSVCPLAKDFRRLVKQKNPSWNPDVVFSLEPPQKIHTEGVKLASSAFTPPTAGLIIASHVINQLLEE